MNGRQPNGMRVRVTYYVLGVVGAIGFALGYEEFVTRPQIQQIVQQAEASLHAREARLIAREAELLEEERAAATPTAPLPRPAVRP